MDLERVVKNVAAADPHGLVESGQLRRLGIAKPAIGPLLAAGSLYRVRRGYYSVHDPRWTDKAAAAQRAAGAGAAISHLSAARAHELGDATELHLSIRYPAKATLAGVAVHRSRDLEPGDITDVSGLVATTVARTLCDLGLVLPATEVQRLVDHAIATELVDPVELMQLRWRLSEHGRNGLSAIDGAIDDIPELAHLTESGPELLLLRKLQQAGLPAPTPQLEVRVGGRTYRLDLAYPDRMIGLEYDGAEYHSSPMQRQRDAQRQRQLEAAGWTIIRFNWADINGVSWYRSLAGLRQALAA